MPSIRRLDVARWRYARLPGNRTYVIERVCTPIRREQRYRPCGSAELIVTGWKRYREVLTDEWSPPNDPVRVVIIIDLVIAGRRTRTTTRRAILVQSAVPIASTLLSRRRLRRICHRLRQPRDLTWPWFMKFCRTRLVARRFKRAGRKRCVSRCATRRFFRHFVLPEHRYLTLPESSEFLTGLWLFGRLFRRLFKRVKHSSSCSLIESKSRSGRQAS